MRTGCRSGSERASKIQPLRSDGSPRWSVFADRRPERVRVRAKEDGLIRRVAAIAAALMLTMLVAAPAFANDLANGSNVPSNSSAYPPDNASDCDGVQAGTGLFHFVHTGTAP